MRISEIEALALQVVDRVGRQAPLEDARIELKAQWPDAPKAARQLAAHANGARGETILWLIGIDETHGVVGASQNDLSTWYPAVQACFDGLAPSVTDVVVPSGGREIVALMFDTSRAPFVVKNPYFGKAKGEVELEVPWREGTSTRSARREDLIRILLPATRLPSLELLGCTASERQRVIGGSTTVEIELQLDLYVSPPSSDRIVFPIHRARGEVTAAGSPAPSPLFVYWIRPPESPMAAVTIGPIVARPDSVTIVATSHEAIVDGPGRVEVLGTAELSVQRIEAVGELLVRAALRPVNADSACEVQAILRRIEDKQGRMQWEM
jgi:hypothetical protein